MTTPPTTPRRPMHALVQVSTDLSRRAANLRDRALFTTDADLRARMLHAADQCAAAARFDADRFDEALAVLDATTTLYWQTSPIAH